MLGSKLENIVLSYPKLKDRIESRDKPNQERDKALKILDEIKADFSVTYIRGFEKLLDSTLPKLYDGIHFNDGGIDFKKLVKESCVVLVPNHQSHADYVAINYMFYKTFRFPLYVAGGKNLNIFPIGTLFRKSGCFFIRRSFASDILYKLTLEAYLYYLLKTGRPIEFFFEGGRSRTGKLLPPRYGLYHMLLDAHKEINREEQKKLLFVPVSIIHEYVPEQRSLTKELSGAKKQKESTGQLFGLFKLFAYQFGNVHINIGRPVEAAFKEGDDEKKVTQDLAFKCFREVGRNMMVTPSSLLATVMLDEPFGALMWGDLVLKSKAIIKYCEKYNIPYTSSLREDSIDATLERTMDIFIGNRKVDVIGRHHQGATYYSIREESRVELLYFKNTILHHFLVPAIINLAWINLFNGEITNVADLKRFFLEQRALLKYEFYLPTVKQFFYRCLTTISDCIGRKVTSLEDLMSLSNKELYSIVAKIGVFARVLNYLNECYYICALTWKELSREYATGVKTDVYTKKTREIFDREKQFDRLIRYPEGYSMPLVKSALTFLEHQKVVERKDGLLSVIDQEKLDFIIRRYEKDLSDLMTLNIRKPQL
ncbi:MAG: hypothetical protein COW00_03300 [Bdellovibrio sp. CG12_big_fil_rev_8_21_14_0_65_39_13]|nr:MAG: hypothetical protein COW78_11555 [Bdellovibrio sp. CG22_combo_CG10-13_8_21_14_all_39_27]PIQ61604.1 MAG: hypothetical protein COW00_03300 [Bdellovibrio sp. CG12_big_fil_rev_8_21_14_0_65_39_13]PIR36036.1 MAG: hypothetical protein COV37_05875 [Bdellovibrio sp. CG11_big_fil_rev_8_21_14_0_20_39_38]PJB53539.1 MAG: hypothetical protein CO099_06595 [Bdellovibrio sp. CG_4_9_14_3_um_filter_39_7]